MDWKSIVKELLRVVLAAVSGWLAGGCCSVPIFNF